MDPFLKSLQQQFRVLGSQPIASRLSELEQVPVPLGQTAAPGKGDQADWTDSIDNLQFLGRWQVVTRGQQGQNPSDGGGRGHGIGRADRHFAALYQAQEHGKVLRAGLLGVRTEKWDLAAEDLDAGRYFSQGRNAEWLGLGHPAAQQGQQVVGDMAVVQEELEPSWPAHVRERVDWAIGQTLVLGLKG